MPKHCFKKSQRRATGYWKTKIKNLAMLIKIDSMLKIWKGRNSNIENIDKNRMHSISDHGQEMIERKSTRRLNDDGMLTDQNGLKKKNNNMKILDVRNRKPTEKIKKILDSLDQIRRQLSHLCP